MTDTAAQPDSPAARRLVGPALAVTAVALVLYGWPVPRLSEELYLPLVKRVADPGYIRGDWTFGGSFGEHWVFDHVFAPVAGQLSVSTFGWLGRLVFWPVLAFALVSLGVRFRLSPWQAAAAVGLWLVGNQSIVGGEWMLGTFEAKTVAYVFLLGALLAATAPHRPRIPLALALLGLTMALHPAVGLWAIWGLGLALLALPETRRATLRWGWLTLVLAVPGILGGLSAAGEATDALRRFEVLVAIPYHTDPFFGGVRLGGYQQALRFATLAGMLAFNLWAYRRSSRDRTQRLFVAFQLAAAVPVVGAVVARIAHWWGYLQLMPLRSFPLLVPLVFFVQATRVTRDLWHAEPAEAVGRRRRAIERSRRRAVILAVSTVAVALVLTAPLLAAPRMVARNLGAWTTADRDAEAFDWVREHTPTSTTCISPIDRQDAFARSERPQVVNWQAIRYDRLGAWKRRVDALVGGPGYFDGPGWRGDLQRLRRAYDRLTPTQIEAIARRYGATCLVSSGRYPFTVLYRAGPVTVYRVGAEESDP